MNSITLITAIHSKLKKAVDGTSTQVATCMINKWRAKINGKEIYNVRGPPGMGDKKNRLKEDSYCFYHPGKLL